MIRPAGKVSANATPASATVLAAGLVKVKLNDVVPFTGMLAAAKDSPNDGGPTTVRLAVAVFPVPAFSDVTAALVFVKLPALPPVTLTESVHWLPAATEPPLSDRLPLEAAAVAVPPQLFTSAFGVEMTIPDGRTSLNEIPVNASVLTAGLVIVKLREVVPPTARLVAAKDCDIAGGVATVRTAVAVLPVPALLELTALLLFVKLPDAVAVTLSASVQLLPVATVPPLRVIAPVAASAVAIPPQLFASPLGVEITNPAGSVSLNPTPVSDTVFAAGLVIVKASEVVLFTAILGAPNDSAMVGAAGELGVGLGLGVGRGVGVGPGSALPPPPPHAVRLAAKQHASIVLQMLAPTLRRPSNFIRLRNFLLPEAYLATIGTKLASCVTQPPTGIDPMWRRYLRRRCLETDTLPVFQVLLGLN